MKSIDELNLNDREKKAITEASRMLKERFPIKEVILFGSKARGVDDEESDIDLMLLTNRPIHWREREKIIHSLYDIELEYDVVISILDTTVSDWETGIFTVFPIRKEITQDGVMVP